MTSSNGGSTIEDQSKSLKSGSNPNYVNSDVGESLGRLLEEDRKNNREGSGKISDKGAPDNPQRFSLNQDGGKI